MEVTLTPKQQRELLDGQKSLKELLDGQKSLNNELQNLKAEVDTLREFVKNFTSNKSNLITLEGKPVTEPSSSADNSKKRLRWLLF